MHNATFAIQPAIESIVSMWLWWVVRLNHCNSIRPSNENLSDDHKRGPSIKFIHKTSGRSKNEGAPRTGFFEGPLHFAGPLYRKLFSKAKIPGASTLTSQQKNLVAPPARTRTSRIGRLTHQTNQVGADGVEVEWRCHSPWQLKEKICFFSLSLTFSKFTLTN